jgi:hypothetical protein
LKKVSKKLSIVGIGAAKLFPYRNCRKADSKSKQGNYYPRDNNGGPVNHLSALSAREPSKGNGADRCPHVSAGVKNA